jgi:hypothetical protein
MADSANSAPNSAPHSARRWALIICGGLLALVVLAGTVAVWRAQHMEEPIRQWVVRSLSEHFRSRVELGSIHVGGFPHMGVTAEDLTIYFHDRADLPPLIHIDKVSFGLGPMTILRLPEYLPAANVQHMTITIPPRGDHKEDKSKEPKPPNNLISFLTIGEVRCEDAVVITLPKPDPTKPEKEPLEWDIHNLKLQGVGLNKSFHYEGTLTNGLPKGEIETRGDFGPFDVDDPGGSPVSGTYKFSQANLNDFRGISGILSSTGTFNGELAELQVRGETDTPDFSLDKVGKPVPLHTEYSATVDGTNGDTLLHPVRATLVQSLILAEGSIVNVPKKGHMIQLNVGAPNARIQDILSLAVNSDQPFLTGPAKLKAKLMIPPGKEKVLEKMTIDGTVGIDDASWTSPEVRAKLESLSRRAEGKPRDEDAGSAVSDIHGAFHMENGSIHFTNLTFSVPGAAVDLAGSYKMQGGDLDFKGHIRLQAKLSQTVTGVKSLFLKAFDPFFKKDGAGAEIPIAIGGTYEHPTFTVVVFHKKIEKQSAVGAPSAR